MLQVLPKIKKQDNVSILWTADISSYALSCPKLNFGYYVTFEIIFQALKPTNYAFFMQIQRFDKLGNPITWQFLLLFFFTIWLLDGLILPSINVSAFSLRKFSLTMTVFIELFSHHGTHLEAENSIQIWTYHIPMSQCAVLSQ